MHPNPILDAISPLLPKGSRFIAGSPLPHHWPIVPMVLKPFEAWRQDKVSVRSVTGGPHDKVSGKNPNPDRMMYNFETRDVKGEFERIKGLGAQVVAEPYQMGENADGWIATFADPDGNYFQLMTPWEEENIEK